MAACLGLMAVSIPETATPSPGAYSVPLSPSRPDQALFDKALLHFANEARRKHGRPPLASDPALARAASDHAKNMARLGKQSHTLPVRGQKTLKQRIKRQSVSFRLAGENLSMDKVYRLAGRPISTGYSGCNFRYTGTNAQVPIHTYATLAEDLVDRWLASPKHRQSLLSRQFTRTGSGFGIDPGGVACGDVYAVQTFAD